MAIRGSRWAMVGVLSVFMVFGALLFGGSPVFAGREVPTKFDPVTASFPSHRIDDQMGRISIIGNGPNCDQIQSILTKVFLEKTQVKVVEPANLQSVLAGKIIEYHTGIAPADAQALSRMFQIDHVLLFDVEMAPYSAYRFGGRYYAVINLKIVNTLNGEILFQASRNVGITCDDPRKYGYTQMLELNDPRPAHAAFNTLAHELRYALGDVSMGCVFKPGTNVITDLLIGSVADKAGIQKGDVLVSINDTTISSDQDVTALFNKKSIKQGDEVVVKVERGGKVLERTVKFPIIPFLHQKKWEQGEKGSPDRDSGATYY